MKGKKIRKYKMATGICGPTILYTNIIKAYNAEEAARLYLEEYAESGEEITEERIADVAKDMFEVIDETPLSSHYDCSGERLEVGDHVLAMVKTQLIKGQVSKLTKRSVKVIANDQEYSIAINANDYMTIDGEKRPCFTKILKEKSILPDDEIKIGCSVAYTLISFNRFDGFGFGTVTRITPSYIYITDENGQQVRKSPGNVHRISE